MFVFQNVKIEHMEKTVHTHVAHIVRITLCVIALLAIVWMDAIQGILLHFVIMVRLFLEFLFFSVVFDDRKIYEVRVLHIAIMIFRYYCPSVRLVVSAPYL